uniref:Serpin B6 n=1 Tax=Junco hyemalis TaxID=40217 RepID=A0A8C5NJF4_JUNHY
MESLCAANSTFAVDLLRKLCEKNSGQNVFFSPFSISSALSMVLLGSRGGTEAQISKKLMGWISPEMMNSTEVMVYLPRFKLEEDYDLKPILRSMGMPDAFESGKANFSGISPGNELVLSEVVHKSFVEVNEEGTEAAAATGLVMNCCAMRVPEFIADHPFLFFIRHNKTSSILFCGRFCCP